VRTQPPGKLAKLNSKNAITLSRLLWDQNANSFFIAKMDLHKVWFSLLQESGFFMQKQISDEERKHKGAAVY